MFRRVIFYVWLAGMINSCVFLGPSREKLFSKAVQKQPYDVIIVPGIPHDTASSRWDLALKGRIYWAKFLYDKGMTKNIIFSGGAVYTPFVESEIMAGYAVSLGIPREHIFMETKAEHSTENIYYSYYLAKRLGFQKIAVATDPFQAKLLRRYPQKMKMNLDFIPFVMDSLRTMDTSGFVKHSAKEHKVPNFVSITDRESRFKRLLGTLGKNVKIDEADERKRKKKRPKHNLDVRAS